MSEEKPNPNWKIDKMRAYLEKVGKKKYKAMWSTTWTADRAPLYNGGLQGRVFQNEEAAVRFVLHKRMIQGMKIWLFKWENDRWEDYNEQG